jgi:hypothetical protein
MTSEEKRVYLLLKASIYYFHGLDPEEKADLEKAAAKLEASEELRWATEFIEKDQLTSFERARAFLTDIVGDYPKNRRVELIAMVWDSNSLKGYVTEMEATAMVKLARDWKVEPELVALVLK